MVEYKLFAFLLFIVCCCCMCNHNTIVLGRVFGWVDLNLFYHVWFCYKTHKKTRGATKQPTDKYTIEERWLFRVRQGENCHKYEKVVAFT